MYISCFDSLFMIDKQEIKKMNIVNMGNKQFRSEECTALIPTG